MSIVTVRCMAILATTILVSPARGAGPATRAMPESSEVPGTSIVRVADVLRRDALKNLREFAIRKYDCKVPRVTDTEVKGTDGDLQLDSTGRLYSGVITEMWTVDACGKTHRLALVFQSDGKGGDYVAIGEVNE